MTTKRIAIWMVVTGCLFVIANGVSYIIRSDGYGLPGVQDGIIRIGSPFLMMERGGFAHREFVSLYAALGNLFVASIGATLVLGVGYFRRRPAGPDA